MSPEEFLALSAAAELSLFAVAISAAAALCWAFLKRSHRSVALALTLLTLLTQLSSLPARGRRRTLLALLLDAKFFAQDNYTEAKTTPITN